MTTNYKKIPMFKIKIEENNFPHLLGLHYCIKNKSATKLCEMIKTEKLLFEDIKKTEGFKQYNIKKRLEVYSYLDVFLKQENGRIFYPTDNMKPNPMKLTLAFSERQDAGEVVLGIRKDSREEAYRLATLHYSRKQIYTNLKTSKILSAEWS